MQVLNVTVINAPDVEIATSILNEELHNLMDKCFPVCRVVMSFHEPPWITPLVKYLLRKKKRAADKGHVHKVEDLLSKVYKSLSSYTWLTAWKEANINPLPKVDTPVQYSDFW